MNTLAGLAAGFMALFGASTTVNHPPKDNDHRMATTTRPFSGSVDIACVAAAVAVREGALGTAASANAQAMTGAYSARASALAAAYALTDMKAIRDAVKKAWSDFGAAMRLAHKSWKNAQQDAWTKFHSAIRSCKGSTNVSDSNNSWEDASTGAGSD